MKTIPIHQLDNRPDFLDQARDVLESGGLVCLPCQASYRIVADLYSVEAINRLLQAKHRTSYAPSLVFVADSDMLTKVTEEVTALASLLVGALWPGPLTILFPAHSSLPRKVVKPLIKANGKVGVRIPEHPVARHVIEAFGRPLLVSSANRERKHGASSPAQIRKNFFGHVDLFLDEGDLAAAPASTVVDLVNDQAVIVRPGAVSAEQIAQLTG